VQRKEIPTDAAEKLKYHSEQIVGSVLTQEYHAMLWEGLVVSYVTMVLHWSVFEYLRMTQPCYFSSFASPIWKLMGMTMTAIDNQEQLLLGCFVFL
jgi:hypothetical protein